MHIPASTTPQRLTIRRPDDWHLHLRDDDILRTVLPYTSAVYRRAIIMPNLVAPVTSVNAAVAYRQRILQALPASHDFQPLMTCYLTDNLCADELERGFNARIFHAAKLYPANATTNSSHGVTSVDAIMPLLQSMEKTGMPLLIHGEVADPAVDIFDREARFIDQVLEPLRRRLPELKIVLEHITTQQAADYVREADNSLAATITPQHLLFNRNHMLTGGIRPHLYCLPILKRARHQQALRDLLASGCDRVFAGTDSAPHLRSRKETHCGCAGCFNAPVALAVYAAIFEETGSLDYFEAFCSLNGPRFYQLPVNSDTITLIRKDYTVPQRITLGDDEIIPFLAGETLNWQVDA